jgi:endonuclease/exonuclease/phosphatase family metal-dependent hydrolase
MRIQLIILALLLPAASMRAAPVRVTAWDLHASVGAGTNVGSNEFQQRLVHEAAESLKKLRPDIIVLQQIADWGTCRQLAQALRPEVYQVATCSSFRDPRAKLSGGQVAILAKNRAYLSWSEPWRSSDTSAPAPGGFAFAAIRVGDKNVGVFSVHLGAGLQPAREESTRQLIRQIDSLQNWKTNRLQAFIVVGDCDATAGDLCSGLEQVGFENAFAGVLAGNVRQPAAMPGFIFTRQAAVVGLPQIAGIPLAEHCAATCEMDLAAPPMQHNRPPSPAPLANAADPAGIAKSLFALTAFVAGFLALFLFRRKIARRLGLRPNARGTAPNSGQITVAPPSEPYVQIVTEHSPQTQSQIWPLLPAASRPTAPMPEAVRAGVIENLSRWLKQKVMRRLVSDRAQLLATQEAAVLKMVSVDERLSKIEKQIKQRNQEYEQRIDDLLKALVTAKEENRELIRAKIALLKGEMEKSRLKAQQAAAERQQN